MWSSERKNLCGSGGVTFFLTTRLPWQRPSAHPVDCFNLRFESRIHIAHVCFLRAMTNGKDVMTNVILVTRTTNFRHSDEKTVQVKNTDWCCECLYEALTTQRLWCQFTGSCILAWFSELHFLTMVAGYFFFLNVYICIYPWESIKVKLQLFKKLTYPSKTWGQKFQKNSF